MKKAGPLNYALHLIVEIDKGLAAISAPAVLYFTLGHEIRALRKQRSMLVSMLQNAGKDLQKAR